MKICVVGAGWFGCHIAKKLIDDGHDVKIFEKENDIFKNASGNNQNRLHQGFHYPRSKKTIQISKEGFNLFKTEYSFLTKKIKNNIYSISNSKKTKINFAHYCKILKKFNLIFKKLNGKNLVIKNFKNLEGSIICNEELIIISKAIKYFRSKLESKIIYNFTVEDIQKYQDQFIINDQKFDFVINCTGFSLKTNKVNNLKYEYCAIFLYKKKSNKKKFSLTIMDGPFFTLYPWNEKNEFGLYSVKNSRLLVSKNLNQLKLKIQIKNNKQFLKKHRVLVEKNFQKYYPNFKKEFSFRKYLLSQRTIIENKFDQRVCNVKKNNGIIDIFPGKIDHIFYAYKKVKKCLKKF